VVAIKIPDITTLRRIVRAKYYLDHARIHANVNSEFDSMLALHHADNAIEFLLRIIIEHYDIENELNKQSDNLTMSGLITLIDEYANGKGLLAVPFNSQIKKLRNLRNHIQHSGVLPISEIKGQLEIAHKAFDRCLTRFFDMKIEDVKFSTIVQNHTLKGIVEDIERFLDSSNYLESVVASRNAFEYARIFVLEYSRRNPEKLPLLLVKGEYVDSLMNYISELEERQTLSGYGIDLYLFDKFNEYIRHIPSEHCADSRGGYSIMQREWNKSDADYCYGFVVDAINKWQTMRIQPLYEIEPLVLFDKSMEAVSVSFDMNEKSVFPIEELEAYGCLYSYSPYHGMRMFVNKVDAEIFRREVSIGDEYADSYGNYIIDNITVNIASNFIPAWEVCVWYHYVDK